MNLGLYTGAAHLAVLENWQSTIASNLANASSPGYQPNTFAVSSAEKPLTKVKMPTQPLQPLVVGKATRVFQSGEVRVTGNPYDLAIHGDGFFGLRRPDGLTVYTKDGEFHRNADGDWVNKMGYRLIAEGDVLNVRLDGGQVTVNTDGTVSQDGENIGRISIFEFARPESLERGNGTYFINVDNRAGIREVEQPIVLQGQLIASGVEPLREMVSMIEVSRAYELTQKVIQENEQRGAKAIQAFS